MDYKAHKYIKRFSLRKKLELLNMAFLKLNFCMIVVSVMCTIDIVENKKLQILESGFNMLRESLSDLELKVFSEELKIRNELEQIWSVLNTSNSSETFKNNQTVNLDSVVDTIKMLEERSRIITNGFTGEKENLRKQVVEFENDIRDFKNQHVEKLERMESKMKQFGEEFVSFKNYIEMKERSSILSMNRSLQQLETKLLDTTYSAIKSDSKTLGDKINTELKQMQGELDTTFSAIKNDSKTLSDKINTELKQMQGELDTTGRKTNQLDSVVNGMKNKIHSLNKQLCAFNGHTYENSCYVLIESRKTWNDASTHCSNLVGYIVEINSYGENRFLTEAYKDKYEMWLGASDMRTEGVWRWKSTNERIGYENWYSGEPNNQDGKEDCMEFDPQKRSGKWNDDNCGNNKEFICEFSVNSPV